MGSPPFSSHFIMNKILSWLLLLSLASSCSVTRINPVNINTFKKPAENPILSPDSSFVFTDPITNSTVQWQKADVFNPAAVVRGEKVFMLYRSEDNEAAAIGGRTSRLGLAESKDGIHFKKFPDPVLYPTNDSDSSIDYPGGCEDPRIVQTQEGLYVMAYTSWNNKIARLSIAFSWDLMHWEKKGPTFAKAYDGRFNQEWSKSGSMITKFVKGKQVLAKINGKYWMYWGEHLINLAWSENLFDWTPMLNNNNELLALASPRPYKFDSDLTECGPPAILFKNGVVLLYNGKNATDHLADSTLPKGTYSTGEIVFDKNDLTTVIRRSDTSFLRPTLSHETTGQYKAGTTFAEALVYFNGHWFLYYGTADSFVGVAVSE